MVAYSATSDLLIGDIPLAPKYGSGQGFVDMAAEEIDAQIGHIYVTPIALDPADPTHRPARLLLKKINNLLASGRLILDMAAGGEDRQLHQYGASMWQEALALLEQICDMKIKLVGATLIETKTDDENTAVSVHNEDEYSLVEEFYRPQRPLYTPLMPYGGV